VADQSMMLEGIRVLDLSRVIAGPYCATLMADLGADVIKVERPGRGDDLRAWRGNGMSATFAAINRNKRGIAVDLQQPEGGKLAWFAPGGDLHALWEEHLIEDRLLDPHSLQLGDVCGSGALDLLVGEIGVKERYTEQPTRRMLYENDGRGQFTRQVIDEGTGTHHARLVDLRGSGELDIASRPLHGPEKWKIIVWYNDRGRGVRG